VALPKARTGMVKHLAEIDFAPHIIAGTSIGALNGALLASNKSFKQSGDRPLVLRINPEKLESGKILSSLTG